MCCCSHPIDVRAATTGIHVPNEWRVHARPFLTECFMTHDAPSLTRYNHNQLMEEKKRMEEYFDEVDHDVRCSHLPATSYCCNQLLVDALPAGDLAGVLLFKYGFFFSHRFCLELAPLYTSATRQSPTKRHAVPSTPQPAIAPPFPWAVVVSTCAYSNVWVETDLFLC